MFMVETDAAFTEMKWCSRSASFRRTVFLEVAEIYCKCCRFSLQAYQFKHLRLLEGNDWKSGICADLHIRILYKSVADLNCS